MRLAATGTVGSALAVPTQTTLLELVKVIGEVTQDEREIVATVVHMLRSGSVELVGNFRGSTADDFTVF
ncbi:MAG: hypothetical protein O7A09_05465 [Proteobacteria bacterium]|nr:hypothetical protein [Pseudomonadota bacterium]MCZ6783227.1 hypothetical protein [Pseudomonadota bacterium]